MKQFIIIALSVMLFTACQKTDKRYTQQSPEIETVKKLITNYNNKTYDTSIYADTSKTAYNSSKATMTPAETIAYHKANDEMYTSRGFDVKDQELEMVLTDDGHTWVNYWCDWTGTLKGNNKEYTIPIHLTYRFIDGKIVRESGYWDPTEIVLARQHIEAEAKAKAVAESADIVE